MKQHSRRQTSTGDVEVGDNVKAGTDVVFANLSSSTNVGQGHNRSPN